MRRRTPILAILLAPVVLLALATFWRTVVAPMSASLWRSSTVLQMRLRSDDSDRRVAALNQVMGASPVDEQLMARVFAAMRTDPDSRVRHAAVNVLGQIGSRQELPDAIRDGLVDLVLEPEDETMMPVALRAVTYSSAYNHYPDSVIERLTRELDESYTEWERSEATRGLARMAEHQSMPNAALARLAEVLQEDPSDQVRVEAVQALLQSAGEFPPTEALLTAASHDPASQVQLAAETALRRIAHDRTFGGREPLALALDSTQGVEQRLQALRILRSTRIEQTSYEDLASLARDPDSRIVIAALEVFHFMAQSPGDDLDRAVLIPELTRAMSHPDPEVRQAAFGAVSRIVGQRSDYRRGATEISKALEVGANDPDGRVRVAALAAMMRGTTDRAERAAILERGLTDSDPYVRRFVVSWLGKPGGRHADREVWFDRMAADPDPDVAATARAARQQWRDRGRAWPVELWRELRAGEYERVGRSAVTAMTVAAPVLICGVFLIYFMARLLTYAGRRSRRAMVALPVLGVWVAASYGMVWLYFIAAHANLSDWGELLLAAAILFGVTAAYGGLGWALHYAVRR